MTVFSLWTPFRRSLGNGIEVIRRMVASTFVPFLRITNVLTPFLRITSIPFPKDLRNGAVIRRRAFGGGGYCCGTPKAFQKLKLGSLKLTLQFDAYLTVRY
jgi:hypothetical protein